ncbi:hypothetical protein ACFL4T_12205, partial [candidate division KSB1 bacterium]
MRSKNQCMLILSVLSIFITGFLFETGLSQSIQEKMKMTKRSMVIGTRGIVATSQPLAALAGL